MTLPTIQQINNTTFYRQHIRVNHCQCVGINHCLCRYRPWAVLVSTIGCVGIHQRLCRYQPKFVSVSTIMHDLLCRYRPLAVSELIICCVCIQQLVNHYVGINHWLCRLQQVAMVAKLLLCNWEVSGPISVPLEPFDVKICRYCPFVMLCGMLRVE